SVPPANAAQRKTRADLLLKARRYNDAADAYRDWLAAASAAEQPVARVALADALHRGGRNRDAQQELAGLNGLPSELNAQRLYILAEIAWGLSDNDTFYRTVNELRTSAPASSWLEQALPLVANLHLVHHEYDQALDAY